MKIKNYLMAAVGFGILVGSIILGQPFVSHSQNQVPPTPVEVTNLPLEVRTVEAPPCCVPKQPFRKLVSLVGDNARMLHFRTSLYPAENDLSLRMSRY